MPNLPIWHKNKYGGDRSYMRFDILFYALLAILGIKPDSIFEYATYSNIIFRLNNRKYLGGYYNKNQNNLLFSIFSGELPNSIFNNMEFFNRYDIMILI